MWSNGTVSSPLTTSLSTSLLTSAIWGSTRCEIIVVGDASVVNIEEGTAAYQQGVCRNGNFDPNAQPLPTTLLQS